MTFAELFCKPVSSDSEDLLTSEVFTAFRYLSPDLGIIRFIRSVEDLVLHIPEPGPDSTCEYYFWPIGQRLRKIPDLLLEFGIKGRVYHIVIEAKFKSGASDGAEREINLDGEIILAGNQLGSQYRDLMYGEYLVRTLEPFSNFEPKALRSEKSDRFHIYLTCDPFPPDKEFNNFPRYAGADAKLYWTSWYHIFDFLSQLSRELAGFPASLILRDILLLLGTKKFDSFQSIPKPPTMDFHGVSGKFWKK